MDWPEAPYWFGDPRRALPRFTLEPYQELQTEVPDSAISKVATQARSLVREAGGIWPADVLDYASAHLEQFLTRQPLRVAFAWSCARRAVETRFARSPSLRAHRDDSLHALALVASTVDAPRMGISDELTKILRKMGPTRIDESQARADGLELDTGSGLREIYAIHQALRIGEGEYALACARLSISAVAGPSFSCIDPSTTPLTTKRVAEETMKPVVQHELFLVTSFMQWLTSHPKPPLCTRFGDERFTTLLAELDELSARDEALLEQAAHAKEIRRRKDLYGIEVGTPARVRVTDGGGKSLSDRVTKSWESLDAFFVDYPAIQRSLSSPAFDSTLAGLESTVGAEMPSDLKDSLRIHDGERGHEWIDGHRLLSTEDIESKWEMFESFEEYEVDPGWSPAMIPVTDSDGDGYFVHAETGEVWFQEHGRGFTASPVAPSWAALLEHIVRALERGEFTARSGGLWLSPRIEKRFE